MSKGRTVDLDAIIAEAGDDIEVTTSKGESFRVPADLPLSVPGRLASGDIVGAAAALVGADDADRFLSSGIGVQGFERFLSAVYNLSAPEAGASPSS
jgi:hypothetical protein